MHIRRNDGEIRKQPQTIEGAPASSNKLTLQVSFVKKMRDGVRGSRAVKWVRESAGTGQRP
jgi:hypothetical protein